jgi:hypothetical protein
MKFMTADAFEPLDWLIILHCGGLLFHGTISEGDEPKIRMLEHKYLEYKKRHGASLGYANDRWHLEQELNALGVHVEVVEHTEYHSTQKNPQPSEFHHYSQEQSEKSSTP